MRTLPFVLVVLTLACSSNPKNGTGGGSATGGGAATGGGSSTGGGSAAGGGTADAGPVVYDTPTLDPATQALVTQLQALADGMPADVNGDGTNDTTTTALADGGTEVDIDLDGDGNPELVSIFDSAGNGTVTLDGNSDGMPDEEQTYTVGPPVKLVQLDDTDFDGLMDHRFTVTYQSGDTTQHEVYEVSANQDGNFSVVSDTQGPVSVSQDMTGDTCNGQQGFPSSTGGGNYKLSGIHIPHGGGGGRCSDAEAAKLLKAYECVMNQGLHCMLATNPGLGLKLFDKIARDTLVVGCGDPCSAQDAATQLGISWIPTLGDGHTNFNPNTVDNQPDPVMCTLALHEALHWVGDGWEPHHDDGKDEVYGCGRYCGGCTSRGPGYMSSNIDCLTCADTPDHKQACGIQQKFVDAPGTGSGLCHDGLACISGDCSMPKGIENDLCDGSKVPGQTPTFSCCAACPSTCMASNDIPCNGTPNLSNTCGMPPPQCP